MNKDMLHLLGELTAIYGTYEATRMIANMVAGEDVLPDPVEVVSDVVSGVVDLFKW